MKSGINYYILIIVISGLNITKAWVYPEHREITLFAIQKLEGNYLVELNSLWAEARKNYEFSLTKDVIVPGQGLKPEALDYASWPAIAGDHSCSAQNMLDNILKTEWILKVADVAAELRLDLNLSQTRKDRINALRDSDIRLQDVDPEYATRAGSNNAHFLIALKNMKIKAETYFNYCIEKGREINAIGVYVLYHYSALVKATKLATEKFEPEERIELIRSMLADEAFAIHFLEDVFAAGHVAGTWGDASQRKGTHDYYNEKGLKTSSWDGEQMVLTGDAWMRNEDAERAAVVISLSLQQLLEATKGNKEFFLFNKKIIPIMPDTFNVCKTNFIPDYQVDPNLISLVSRILTRTPVPGLATGLGELPRFRAELGMFAGISGGVRGSVISGGFSSHQETVGLIGGLEAAIRFGVGLEGVLNESGDGLVFVELGWRQDGASTSGVVKGSSLQNYGNLFAAIPGRSAFSARLRLPFYVIPGDLLIVGPLLLLFDQEALTNMGVKAVNGGLVPWQAGIATSFGRFQFVLGREVSVFLFGRSKVRDALFAIAPDINGNEALYILSYRSTQIEFPVLDYRPFRSFATNQSSSLLIQFYTGLDFPHNIANITSELEGDFKPKLNKIWYLGARLIFDWRHYF